MKYNQSFQASYKLPINLIPVFDWITADGSYNATYNWMRGSDLEDGTSLGNTIANNRQININGQFNMEKLYNHVPFLKKTNDRFKKDNSAANRRKAEEAKKKKREEAKKKREAEAKEKGAADGNQKTKKKPPFANDSNPRDLLAKKKKGFEKEITLMPDTTIKVNHGKRTKRIIVSGRTEAGRVFQLKYKRVDDNNHPYIK